VCLDEVRPDMTNRCTLSAANPVEAASPSLVDGRVTCQDGEACVLSRVFALVPSVLLEPGKRQDRRITQKKVTLT